LAISLGLLITPIWYLAAPITFPVYFVLFYQPSTCMYCTLLSHALAAAVGFLGFPVLAGQEVVAGLFKLLGLTTAQTTAAPSTASTVTAKSAGNSANARAAQATASSTSRAAHSARNLVNNVVRPITRASSVTPEPVAGTALDATTATEGPEADTTVEAEKGTQNTTGEVQGHRGAQSSANDAAPDAKSSGSNGPSIGSSGRGNSNRGQPN
jgi:hypothetical protein